MNFATVVVLALLAIAFALAVRRCFKRGTGCGCGCSGCTGCSHHSVRNHAEAKEAGRFAPAEKRGS
ncbi:MAG: FeoB-associated Cys-rich membrane protein [Kiritimatiellae bacterium]|nr:FeoB-associated Cys-rich membrane protein [Kiritimatiellia bacterium]